MKKTFELSNGAIITSMNDEDLKRSIMAAVITEMKQSASIEASCHIYNHIARLLRIPVHTSYEGNCIVWEFKSTSIQAKVKAEAYLVREILDKMAYAIEKYKEDDLRDELLHILSRELPILALFLKEAKED